MEGLELENSIVVDLTYRCNANCEYCQWGSTESNGRDLSLNEILIPKQTLYNMKITKVVFSGGEPLLHKKFEEIVSYYKELGIIDIIIISNGLLITENKLNQILEFGINGITISFDSVDPIITNKMRGMTENQQKLIIKNILMLSEYKKKHNDFEFGINVVLSKINIERDSTVNTIKFLNNLNLDFVKFQPIFNDGYVQKNAPELLFEKEDSIYILEAGNYISNYLSHISNSISFYQTISHLLEGAVLDGASCGLDSNQSILIKSEIKFCYWIDEPIYGNINNHFSLKQIGSTVKKFIIEKSHCKTDIYCFCLQKLDHNWKVIK